MERVHEVSVPVCLLLVELCLSLSPVCHLSALWFVVFVCVVCLCCVPDTIILAIMRVALSDNNNKNNIKLLPAEGLRVDEFKCVSSNVKSWMLKYLHSTSKQPTHTHTHNRHHQDEQHKNPLQYRMSL